MSVAVTPGLGAWIWCDGKLAVPWIVAAHGEIGEAAAWETGVIGVERTSVEATRGGPCACIDDSKRLRSVLDVGRAQSVPRGISLPIPADLGACRLPSVRRTRRSSARSRRRAGSSGGGKIILNTLMSARSRVGREGLDPGVRPLCELKCGTLAGDALKAGESDEGEDDGRSELGGCSFGFRETRIACSIDDELVDECGIDGERMVERVSKTSSLQSSAREN